jgi:hypothetical protein
VKRCPFCAEEIQDAAIKCRYCGSMLNQEALSTRAEAQKTRGLGTITCPFCEASIPKNSRVCPSCQDDVSGVTGMASAPAQPKSLKPVESSLWTSVEATAENMRWGTVNPVLLCPQCGTKGHVRTLSVKRKKGVSGAKATGAVLTLGWSLLATGLSRKEHATQAHCDACNSTWDF